MSRLDERAWIQEIKAGNHEAYAQLVAIHQTAVYRICLQFTKDPILAQDLAQDSMIKAFCALHGFRENSSFSTWLYQITMRTCLDWRRKDGRERKLMRQDGLADNTFNHHGSPESQLIDQETRQQVQAWVELLKEPYRQIVVLFYFHHYSYQEISEKLGVPVKTIESQLYRARHQLRQMGGPSK